MARGLLNATLFAEVSESLLVGFVVFSTANVLSFPSLLCTKEVVVMLQVLHLVEQHVRGLFYDSLLCRFLQRWMEIYNSYIVGSYCEIFYCAIFQVCKIGILKV